MSRIADQKLKIRLLQGSCELHRTRFRLEAGRIIPAAKKGLIIAGASMGAAKVLPALRPFLALLVSKKARRNRSAMLVQTALAAPRLIRSVQGLLPSSTHPPLNTPRYISPTTTQQTHQTKETSC